MRNKQQVRKVKRMGGFSLIELLVVGAIIAVLAALAVPNLPGSRKAANEASAIESLRTIHTAQMMYYNKYHKFAATLTELYAEQLIDSALATADTEPKAGYFITLTGATVATNGRNWLQPFARWRGSNRVRRWHVSNRLPPPDDNSDLRAYTVKATRLSDNSGDREFSLQEDGLLRWFAGAMPSEPRGLGTPLGAPLPLPEANASGGQGIWQQT